jgi:hypothetical protein
MGIYEVNMRVHSRQDITKDIQGLYPCIVHSVMPVITKTIAGRHRSVFYSMACPRSAACDRCTGDEREIVTIWNKWNPVMLCITCKFPLTPKDDGLVYNEGTPHESYLCNHCHLQEFGVNIVPSLLYFGSKKLI